MGIAVHFIVVVWLCVLLNFYEVAYLLDSITGLFEDLGKENFGKRNWEDREFILEVNYGGNNRLKVIRKGI